MTVFDNAMAAAKDAFHYTFDETITYQPSVLDREINAKVSYPADDATVPPVQRHRSPDINIRVDNDSTTGISASEFEPGQTVSVPPRKGATAVTKHLSRIVKESLTFVTYEVH